MSLLVLLRSSGGPPMGFRSSSSLTGSSSSSAAVPVPSGAAVNDIAVVAVYKENTAAITPPSGFTQKAALTTSGTVRGTLYVFWKRLTAADSGTYTFSWSGSTFRAGAGGLWSGRVTTGDPFDGTVGTAESTSAVSTLNVSTSPAAANGDAVGFWTNFNGGAGFTQPTNYTERVDVQVITMDTRDAVAAGSTGNVSATASISDFMKAFLGVLAVAGGSNFTQTPTDNEGITDTVQVETPGSLRPEDAEPITDSTILDRTQVRTDNLGLTDSVTIAGPARFVTGIAGSGNQQYPVDQNSDPILVKGDVIWAFPANAGRWNAGDWQGDITDYLDVRQAQGFNLLMIGALGSTQNGGPADTGATHDGVLPFSGGNGVLNNTYWTRVDYIVDEAAARGITVLMNVAYSYDMDSASLSGFSNANYTTYGTNLGNRYKTKTNLIWGAGGDYFDTQATQLGSLFTAIQATGDTHLISIQNYPESTSRKDIFNNGTNSTGVTWSDWNFVYSYNVTYDGVEYAYDETSPICVIWGDGHFDQDSTPDRKVMRDLVWWALSSGARGHIYGSEGTWNWQSGALANASSETVPSTDLANYWETFTGFTNWHQLVPDTNSSFVTAGRGTHAAALSSGGGGGEYNSSDTQDQYVTASITPDGTLAVVYFPVDQTITVDDTELAAGYTATWVDPTNGATSSATIAGTYSPTGTNALGGPDWLLVFESSGASHTQTPGDTLGLADTAALSTGKAPADTEGLTDVAAREFGNSQADNLGLTDVAGLQQEKAPADSLGITDTALVEKSLTQTPVDTLGATDTAALTQGEGAGDTEGLTDSATLDRIQVVVDAAGLTDAVSLSGSGTIGSTDNLGLTDAVTLDRAFGYSDNLGVADDVDLELARLIADTEGLTDTASVTVGRQPADTLGLSDSFSLTGSGSLSLTDNLALSDVTVLDRTLVLTETAGLSDVLVLATARAIVDTAALTDSVQTQLNPVSEVTPRPYTGDTSRPSTSTTPRPFTGITARP